MSDGILYRCRAHAGSIWQVGEAFEAWHQAHHEAIQVHDLEGWIEECLTARQVTSMLRAAMDSNAREVWESDPARFGEALLKVFDAVLRLMSLVQDRAQAMEQQGYEVAGAEQLRQAFRHSSRERLQVVRTWPTDTNSWDRARAQIEAGQGYTLEEVRDELRRRRAAGNPRGDQLLEPPARDE
jgi:hypothetical protein